MLKHDDAEGSNGRSKTRGFEAIFQALPALDSNEYLVHVRTVPASDLPPEVLVRAFRQLPPGSEASKETLERLFRRQNKRWDYLGPLVAYARRQSQKSKRDSYKDLLQDALKRILETLPTNRGEYAERFWHTFCRRELSDAWRERHGRRGERFPREEREDLQEPSEGAQPPRGSDPRPLRATLETDHVERIEKIALRVLSEIQDDFVRGVASEAWFKNKRPKLSGRPKPDQEPPLSTVFEGKSRFQITRALRHADAQLAAALLAESDVEWSDDLQTLLEELKAGRPGLEGRMQEQKK